MKRFLTILAGILLGAGITAVIDAWYTELQHPAVIDILHSTLSDLRLTGAAFAVGCVTLAFVHYKQYRDIKATRIALEEELEG